MRVLVSGADGQLGTTLGRLFAAEDDVRLAAHADLDLTRPDQVRAVVADARPDVVINCAAYNDVDGAEDQVELALSVNAFGVRALAHAARDVGARLVHYSSDFVFDGTADRPYTEDDRPNPRSVYATSKLLGEWFARAAPHYVLRVESLFGGGALEPAPSGRARGSSLDRMADTLLAGRPIHAFTDRTVSPSYVDDVAHATRALLRTAPPQGVYHCVGTGHATWVEVAVELARCLGVSPTIRPITLDELDLPASRPKYCALSNQKLGDVGVAMPTWQEAVGRYADKRCHL